MLVLLVLTVKSAFYRTLVICYRLSWMIMFSLKKSTVQIFRFSETLNINVYETSMNRCKITLLSLTSESCLNPDLTSGMRLLLIILFTASILLGRPAISTMIFWRQSDEVSRRDISAIYKSQTKRIKQNSNHLSHDYVNNTIYTWMLSCWWMYFKYQIKTHNSRDRFRKRSKYTKMYNRKIYIKSISIKHLWIINNL